MAIKYIISDSGAINESNEKDLVKDEEDQGRRIVFEFNPVSGEESLSCEAGKNVTVSDLILSSVAVLLGVYQAIRRSSGEKDAEIMKEHIASLVNNSSFWNYSQHQDDAIDFRELNKYRS